MRLMLLLLAPAVALAQQPLSDEITVTATRTETRLSDTPASVVVLGSDELAVTAAATLDDALRQVPGFTLFRRGGSRVANPTAQGVSLRGVGASGASRAAVLDDGIPLNDPFGGWVYWGRVPRAAIERAEVLRGGGSDLYGSSAMSGAIQFVRRRASSDAIVVEASGGSNATATTSLFAAAARGVWRGSLAADLFTTDGFVLVEPDARGAVDVRADSRHTTLDATVERALEAGDRVFARLSHFRESRQNGTPLQANDTTIHQLALGLDRGALLLRAYGSEQDYEQTFSAITADRESERLTVEQQVPSRSAGANLQWSHVVAAKHALVVGVEGRQVSGASEELQFPLSSGAISTRSFGRQRTIGAFVEDVFIASDALSFTGGLRVDSWCNFDAERDGTSLADREDTAWSPRLSALYRANQRIVFTASAYRAFRAPTLNELYRGFRVGNIETLANESLGPERLTALEVGVRFEPVRVTFFSMSTDDAIANVTLSSTPLLITRQRQNLGTSRTRGAELESDFRLARDWRLSAGWLWSDARVTSGALDGKRLPQVPRHQATAQLTWSSRTTVAMQARWSAAQFDDDLNQLRLGSFFSVDLFASRPLTRALAATVAVENALDRRIESSATPVITLANGREWRVGVRYRN